ncbi:MAG TPA: cyclopropane fatty acyl phospholipid synthase [Devosiaceae bacterium]|nr:cyclopropane fatty acyl phospholipid synthase [Devosiaceae bacterium]
MSAKSKAFIADLLKLADVEIDGTRPWDLRVNDDRLYDRVMSYGTLGFGEAYMDGWWEAEAIDELIYRLLKFDVKSHVKLDFSVIMTAARSRLLNLQRRRVFEVGEKHYDIGNELYSVMLDKRMIYSCGYWQGTDDLDEAQEKKLDLICRKAGLQPGMRILDIGSGWGGFLRFAAERYGVEGVGLTISKEQAEYANANRGNLPVETRLQDYLSMDGKFDRIISIGMFEHVGVKNYRAYMQKVRDLLAPEGLFVLHTIGGNLSQSYGDPWADKYIFPNGMLPSPMQLGKAVEGLFVMEDWHNFGAYYDPTLMAWLRNFDAAWPALSAQHGDKYDERFQRMWRYYLASFAGAFRSRVIQLWQVVLSPEGVVGGYQSIR